MAKKKKKTNIDYSIVSLTNPKSTVSEAYRTLRTNIQFANVDKDIKSIIVTSSNPNEGKSTTSVNLAITMAMSNQKVLLIDGDLRKPTVHKYFGMSGDEGLTNIIKSSQGIGLEYIHKMTDIPNLYVLPCGPIPPNPTSLLSSKKMKTFLEDIGKQYDVIIIDTPPVGPVSDATILSTLVEGVLIVCKQGETLMDSLIKTKDALAAVNANILGVVINGVKRNGDKYDYAYYQYGED